MATTPSDPIVILSYARTPMGSFQGALAGVSATELGATAVKAAVERAGHHRRAGGQGVHGQRASRRSRPGPGAPGGDRRGAAQLGRAVTINKVCGSGMQAAICAHDMLARAGR